MLRLIKVNDGRYDRYEELLIERDNLRKDSAAIQIAYFREFGDLLTSSFAEQINCIKLKKQIAICQSFINRGQAIDADAVHDRIAQIMSEYEQRLDEMYADTEAAKNCLRSDPGTVIAVRSLYRRIAKKIHPDINPRTDGSATLKELWQRVVTAYHANALDELQELDVLIAKALADCGDERVLVDIPDIEDKIKALEDEIETIKTTDPYQYRFLLGNPELVRQKKDALKEEIAGYEEYRDELKEIFNRLLEENGVKFRWKMD